MDFCGESFSLATHCFSFGRDTLGIRDDERMIYSTSCKAAPSTHPSCSFLSAVQSPILKCSGRIVTNRIYKTMKAFAILLVCVMLLIAGSDAEVDSPTVRGDRVKRQWGMGGWGWGWGRRWPWGMGMGMGGMYYPYYGMGMGGMWG
ncbi:hypothetical protein Tcan_01430 [Toxocara canis]|uniref:Uncharacterized protein n=1 Tax=Toxocara canis TaxID=6265 RepID=A0A0B2V9F2_TOXCA|nr:hypothetical protein Tcan_01430 [Toxocara canis]